MQYNLSSPPGGRYGGGWLARSVLTVSLLTSSAGAHAAEVRHRVPDLWQFKRIRSPRCRERPSRPTRSHGEPQQRILLSARTRHLHAVYDTYLNDYGPGTNANGHDLVNAPHWNLSGGFGYDLPVHITGSLRLAVDANWSSSAYSSAVGRPQDRVPEQGYLNANLTWTSSDGRLSAILSGKNVLDSQKLVSSSYTPSVGIWFYNFADPATVDFTLKYRI